MLDTRAGEVAKHTGATQTTDAGRVGTVAAYSSGDSLSSRLIASRTSAPPSVAILPWRVVGEKVCARNINNRVLPRVFPAAGCPFGNPDQVDTFTLATRN